MAYLIRADEAAKVLRKSHHPVMSRPVFTDAGTGRRIPGDPELRERDQRLEALKAVAGRLAHDFNNFLAPQYGYITLLKDELASATTAAAYVGAMEMSAVKTEA